MIASHPPPLRALRPSGRTFISFPRFVSAWAQLALMLFMVNFSGTATYTAEKKQLHYSGAGVVVSGKAEERWLPLGNQSDDNAATRHKNQPNSVDPDESRYLYHYDQVGNTTALTDSHGAVVERVAYSPYGLVRYRQSNFDTPFLYGGFWGVMSDPNGLVQMRARYYNPITMRFVSSDPAHDGWNWYRYANGDPVAGSDPSGLGAARDLSSSGSNYLGFSSSSPQSLFVDSLGKGNYGAAAGYAAQGFFQSVAISAVTLATEGLGRVAAPVARETEQLIQSEFSFARGASIQTPGVTSAGEVFVRVGATEASTAVRSGSYATPVATFNNIGKDPLALKNALDLPGSAPQFFRYIRPAAGTPIQRGIVPGGEFGGVGGSPEVIFPKGVN